MEITCDETKRFFSKINKTDGCWLWTESTARDGYGAFYLRGKQRAAHRISYLLHNGPIPEGMCICHKCDVRHCVNPEHLFCGTNLDNVRDRDAKGRTTKSNVKRILTAKQAIEIFLSPKHGQDLAKIYPVSPTTINNVQRRATWREQTANLIAPVRKRGWHRRQPL